jgi:hypothetical protein
MITSVLPSRLRRADFGTESYNRTRAQTIGAFNVRDHTLPRSIIAGPVPATPIYLAQPHHTIGVAGTSPAMANHT